MDWRIADPLLKLLPRRYHVPPIGSTPHDVLLEVGRSRLLKYLPVTPPERRTPVVLVPSVVNRHTIMDLVPGRSVAEHLRDSGFPTYMVDWGAPGPEDAGTTLDDLLFDRLETVVHRVQRDHGCPPTLVGYCMGGTMSLVYAAKRPGMVRNLVLLAAPVDFDHLGLLTRWARFEGFDIDDTVDTWGVIPPKIFQPGFTLLRPAVITRKWVPFIQFAKRPEALQAYLPLFRWATENVPLPGEVLRTWVKDYFRENRLVRGSLRAGGGPVDVGCLTAPVLNVYGEADHIVETASTRALDRLLPSSHDYETLAFAMGHTDLSVGPHAMTRVWPAVAAWLTERDAPKETP